MIFIGIDPGQDGGIVSINDNAQLGESQQFSGWKDAFKFLSEFSPEYTKVCIEKLWGMPIRGSQGNWSLGGNYTTWKALLEILGLSYIEASPATWQPKILNTSKKKSKETKPLAIQYVNKRYPQLNFAFKRPKDIKENSGVSDAICIALYGRFVHMNQL